MTAGKNIKITEDEARELARREYAAAAARLKPMHPGFTRVRAQSTWRTFLYIRWCTI